MSMENHAAFEYVNRKEQRYYLCETKTKTGNRDTSSRVEIVGEPIAAVPAGYEVAENVNGVVSLRKAGS